MPSVQGGGLKFDYQHFCGQDGRTTVLARGYTRHACLERLTGHGLCGRPNFLRKLHHPARTASRRGRRPQQKMESTLRKTFDNRMPTMVWTISTALTDCRLLVVGDLIIDEYICGEMSSGFHRKRRCRSFRVDVRKEYTLGGAGNVVNNLAALGARVSVAGVVGSGP